jgi:hypothetical protein
MNKQLQITVSVKLFEPILNKYYIAKGQLLEEVKNWYQNVLNQNLEIDDTIEIRIISLIIKDEKLKLQLDLNFKNKEEDPEEMRFIIGYIIDMLIDEIDDDGNYPFITDENEYLIELKTENYIII